MDNKFVVRLEKPVTIKNSYCRILRLTKGAIFGVRKGMSVGIDPGVNFGITLIKDRTVNVYHGTLMKSGETNEYARIAYKFWQDLISFPVEGKCIVEGAAYHKMYGQVELAEVRTGFYLAACFLDYFDTVKVVPPASIRKLVFNNHLQQAADIWPTMNHNGADSLSMAIYGLLL